jgi:hypothetical protein
MFPTSNKIESGKITRDKAISMSKTMSKFLKKPKRDEPGSGSGPGPRSESNHEHEPVFHMQTKEEKSKKKRRQQQDMEDTEDTEDTQINYIGDKEDLKNLDFLFRETTGYEVGEDKDKDTDTDTDTDRDHEEGEKGEKGEKHFKILYPFSHKYSLHFSQDYKEDDDQNTNEILVEFLIYRIKKHAYKPFLEFMLYKADDDKFYLPNLIYNGGKSKSSASVGGSGSGSDDGDHAKIYDKVVSTLDAIFIEGKYKIKGKLIPTKYMNNIDKTYLSERYILFVESTLHDTENEQGNTSVQYIPEETKLWWVTISEIFNYKKVLFFPVHDSVVNLFYSYPEMMNIFMGGKMLEIPIVVYNGNNDNYTKYNAIFSLKKSPQFSRYGPFYYFTDLHSSFKYACYDVDGGNMRKFERGGLLRTIIFPKKIKMFLERDKIDDSAMAQYLFNKHPEKIFTGQFRDNDNKWTTKYNTAYNGEYTITYDRDKFVEKDKDKDEHFDEKTPFPVMFCVSQYNQQQVISYHYVDTKGIPDKYSYEFKDYKLL